MPDPREIYSLRMEERRASLVVQERRHRTMGTLQLAAVGAALALVALSLFGGWFSVAWVVVP
ncbi:MAG TPA: hypothetical protein VMJ70_10800, partial [Candidatus Sulfotelmatobacter sp.]|nr:hypothetical protein [Candidatus Sulfotelmatobacter sp.]